WSEPWWLLPVGALAVTFWVGGFDVFYALPDEAFDRAERLESLVVRLGQAPAILVAKLWHGLALVALVLFGIGAHLGLAYYGGTAPALPGPDAPATRGSQLPVILAITVASGAPYGARLLEMLVVHNVPTWLLVSSHGWRLLGEECGITDDRALKKATGGDWAS